MNSCDLCALSVIQQNKFNRVAFPLVGESNAHRNFGRQQLCN